MKLTVIRTSLPEVLVLEPRLFGDDRGWFMETFNAAEFRELGLPVTFEQDNHSCSRKGVVRGLHYQLDPPQAKLVRCTRGLIRDVAVDIRRGSPTFGRWTHKDLSADNRLMMWIPEGFAHGFAVLSDEAEVVYKCTALWNGRGERSLLWNDPALAIDWGVTDPTISEKDAAGKPLAEAELFEP